MLIRVKQLSAGYGDEIIFTELGFELMSGQCLHIVGDNGAGKSTLLKIISGLKKRLEGTIERAKDIKLAYLGHELGLMDELTVSHNLNWYHGISDKQKNIEDIKHQFELSSLWSTRVLELSRGQRQRVALARVAMSQATVWILDEALTALDKDQQNKFFKILSEHLSQGGGAIMATHLTHLPIAHTTLRLNHVYNAS